MTESKRPLPPEILTQFSKRLTTLQEVGPNDPTFAAMVVSYAREFQNYPALSAQLLAVGRDAIRTSRSTPASTGRK